MAAHSQFATKIFTFTTRLLVLCPMSRFDKSQQIILYIYKLKSEGFHFFNAILA